jgi:Beta-lactamase
MSTDAVADFVEAKGSELGIPGVALGARVDGRQVHACHGVTSVENPLPVDPATMYLLGSGHQGLHRGRPDASRGREPGRAGRAGPPLSGLGWDLILSPANRNASRVPSSVAESSPGRARLRSPHRAPQAHASACVYPPRSRSSAPSLRGCGRRSGSPAETPELARCHALQVTPAILGGGRHGDSRSDPEGRQASRATARMDSRRLPIAVIVLVDARLSSGP